jgi:hypothetical protein
MTQHGVGAYNLASIPYLVSEGVLDRLRRGSGRDLDAFLAPHVRGLVTAFRSGVDAETLLVTTASLSTHLEQFHRRRSPSLAKLFGLEASLLLAAGRTLDDANRALARASQAVAIARRAQSPGADLFVAEHEMVAAVALKAAGRVDESINFSRTAAAHLGSYPLAIPLVRQEVLMLQDHAEFERLLERAPEYRGSNSREYYRTIKRSFEFRLNHEEYRAAQDLIPELIWGYAASRRSMGVLDRVSLLKNIGHLLGVRGEFSRALAVLRLAGAVAKSAQLEGQSRQIAILNATFATGERDAQLVSFQLAA